jgi:hypothetical protein
VWTSRRTSSLDGIARLNLCMFMCIFWCVCEFVCVCIYYSDSIACHKILLACVCVYVGVYFKKDAEFGNLITL